MASTFRPTPPARLEPEALYRRCDPATLSFTTTAELEDLDIAVGQDRALEALDFGVHIRQHGFNIFVLGPSGSHRHATVEEFLKRHAPPVGDPSDWCYVNNFDDERKPLTLKLPPGKGSALRRDMERLVDELREAIPAAFESEHYRNSVAEIDQELEDRHRASLERLQQEARRENVGLMRTPAGFAIAPIRNGEPLTDQEFERLPADEQERTRQAMTSISEKLRQHIESMQNLQKERRERIKALNRHFTELAAGAAIDALKAKYGEFPHVVRYLDRVRDDVLANPQYVAPPDIAQIGPMPPFVQGARPSPAAQRLRRYEVNVVVDHSDGATAPIVYEQHPSLSNLVGRIEHTAQFGALVTDFTMIRPGALHRANGGYLVLDAERLLTEPLAWTALKRALFSGEIRIETPLELLSLVTTVTLEPEPVPLDLKVVLIGERLTYYLLCELDPDFADLFKVAADFENRIDRNGESAELYSRLIASLARRNKLLPLRADAVARVIEHASRLIGDAEKLTTRYRDIADLVREASFWAEREGAPVIERRHVQKAIDAQTRRVDRLREEFQEEIERNDLLIDTSGAKVGQVNGLSVFSLGSFQFGQPTRITANVRIGDGQVVDIEREIELGGAIHSKGVLILSAYLGTRYAQETPLSIHATLVFEQTYSGVEGDSASVAETCALLSAISGLPIKQSLAVTGSVNQHGQVQVIGGVNEKIEGFFDTCKRRGLTGEQGVLIPKDNVKHLMLREDVVEAVRQNRFHVYPISTIDEAITLLTGVPAGERDARGRFPRGSVNYRVEKRLKELAEKREAMAQEMRKGKRGKGKTKVEEHDEE
ncbi:MAG: AAA family ATPase [Gammaproteobacteria bacterium]|nr:ATP-dependent protease [Gammaproteobacteria bacterium]